MNNPRVLLRDEMLAAPDEIDPDHLPPRFEEARGLLRRALASMAARDIPSETVVTVLLSEMLPRMVFERGPVWTATMLGRLAKNLGPGPMRGARNKERV